MIFTDRTITVQKGTSSINDTIVLYRGDKDVEIRFTLNEGSPFRFGSGSNPNIIEKTEAAYGQLIIKTPNNLPPIFSEVVPTNKGKIIFTITAEMIDEITEVGNYAFQIRLLDESMNGRVTLPEVVNGIEIREPIATEDTTGTNEVDIATVGYAIATADTPEDTFDSQGNYNKTTWAPGDRITASKLNKIEAGIDGVNKKVSSGGAGNVDLSSYAKKTDLPTKTSQLTNDSGYITNIPSEYITEAELKAKKYVTEQYVDDVVHDTIIRNEYIHPATHPASMITGLSTVATSGSYNDLADKPTIPTRTSELANNSDFVDSAFVSQKIAEASLSGGEVDLSGYVTKETGNANQITFADGKTFQEKLDAGILKGEKGDTGVAGTKGDKGDKGDTGATGANGENGATFTPSVDAEGNLSWTNDKGLVNPPTVNIKGEKGDAGTGGSEVANIDNITPKQTTFMHVSKNLFNKDDLNNAKGYINPKDGTVVPTSANCITDYIPCNPEEQYVKNYAGEVAFYTENKTFVSIISNNVAIANYSWTIPDTAYYMRVNFRINGVQFNNAQLELGTIPTEYESFKYILDQNYLPIKDIINSSEHKAFHSSDNAKQFYNITECYKDIQLMKYGAVAHNIKDESLVVNKSKSSLSLFNRFNEYNYAYINKAKTDAVDIPINVNMQNYNETDFIYLYIIYKCNTTNIIPKLITTPFNMLSPTIYDFYDDYKIAEFISQKNTTTVLNKLNFTVGTAIEQNVNFSFLAPYCFIASQEMKGLSAYKDKILSIKNSPYNKYEGLKYVSIGDSITEQGLYQKYVVDELNLSHFVNRGIGGCTLSNNENTDQVPIINRYQTDLDTDADIITLYGGCNDFGQNRIIDNADNLYDTSTVCGALRTIIEWVYTNFPNKVFIVMNLIPNYYPGREAYDYKNSAGKTVKEYSDAITKVCEEYSVPVADLFSNCYIGKNNHTTMLADGVHPNETGHRRIANILISKLKSI